MPGVSNETGQPEPTWITHPWVEASRAAISFGIVNGPRTDRHALSDFVLQIETLGLDGFWLSDHPVQTSSPPRVHIFAVLVKNGLP